MVDPVTVLKQFGLLLSTGNKDQPILAFTLCQVATANIEEHRCSEQHHAEHIIVELFLLIDLVFFCLTGLFGSLDGCSGSGDDCSLT